MPEGAEGAVSSGGVGLAVVGGYSALELQVLQAQAAYQQYWENAQHEVRWVQHGRERTGRG
jgi:hypothetical protein